MSDPYDDLNRLHSELDHLGTVQRAAARLARALTEDLTDGPSRQADELARLLEVELEPEALSTARNEEGSAP